MQHLILALPAPSHAPSRPFVFVQNQRRTWNSRWIEKIQRRLCGHNLDSIARMLKRFVQQRRFDSGYRASDAQQNVSHDLVPTLSAGVRPAPAAAHADIAPQVV